MSYKNHSQSSSDLKKAAQVVEDACKNVTKVRTDLVAEVQALMSGWKGGAADAYRTSYGQFDEQFRVVLDKLDEFHGKLVDTNIQYDRNEAEQVAVANEVSKLISGSN